jgi:AcrR family transcriptional regulator
LPPRDQNDYEHRRQQIIDGALQVFASKGFERATNKDIARAAKVRSPGLIYHYFKDKGDLFQQVVRERAAAVLQLLDHSDDLMDLPPREVLTRFGSAFVNVAENRTSVAMMKLMLSEAVRHPAIAQLFNSIGPGRGLGFLTRYLERQMDAGVLRRMDPGAAARCFVGPLVAYVLTRDVFVQPDSATLRAETMVATAVDVFLRGMEMEPPDGDKVKAHVG